MSFLGVALSTLVAGIGSVSRVRSSPEIREFVRSIYCMCALRRESLPRLGGGTLSVPEGG